MTRLITDFYKRFVCDKIDYKFAIKNSVYMIRLVRNLQRKSVNIIINYGFLPEIGILIG